MSELLDERNRQRKKAPVKVLSNAVPGTTNAGELGPGKSDLNALVQSVKHKMGQNRGRKRIKKQS